MNIANVIRGARGFEVTWEDASATEFPFIWLRDNDPGELHPDTRERVFDLTTVSLDIHPESYIHAVDSLVVNWPRKRDPSVYSSDWLHSHRPGERRSDPSSVEAELWSGDTLTRIPRCSMPSCRASHSGLLEALILLKRYGILIVDQLDDAATAGEEFGEMVGFRRRTNFGDMFEVISKPDPNNLAYTALALPLHTDLPNQEIIPGYQILHCYRNSATGGESIFADGFRISEDLRVEDPDAFDLLGRIEVPWRFHDDEFDIRSYRPVINVDAEGRMAQFVFNAHIADLPDMPSETLYEFYAAYQDLMKRIRQPGYAVRHSLQPGEMVIFDNTRVLHGRNQFDPNSGGRHLRGYYIEKNEVDSRIRVLHREET